MKLSILYLLASVSSYFLSPEASTIETKNKFCLVFKVSDDFTQKSKDLMVEPLMDEEISSRFTYEFITKVKEEEESIITEIYYEDLLLGKVYGSPNKKFLLQILPILEDQIDAYHGKNSK